jgi:uncharacterized membrane protein
VIGIPLIFGVLGALGGVFGVLGVLGVLVFKFILYNIIYIEIKLNTSKSKLEAGARGARARCCCELVIFIYRH